MDIMTNGKPVIEGSYVMHISGAMGSIGIIKDGYAEFTPFGTNAVYTHWVTSFATIEPPFGVRWERNKHGHSVRVLRKASERLSDLRSRHDRTILDISRFRIKGDVKVVFQLLAYASELRYAFKHTLKMVNR